VLAKVNTEEMPDVAMQYGIRSIPNVKLFIDATPVNEFVGALPEPAILEWLKRAIPPKKIAEVETAETLLEDLQFEKARKLLEPVVQREPGNHKASALLAKALFFTNPDRAVEVVSDIEADSDYHDLVEAMRVFYDLGQRLAKNALPEGAVRDRYIDAAKDILKGDFDRALPTLIDVVREDRYYDDDGPRRVCIGIFKYLGEEHPTTLKYRKEFNRALFS
jgi:putative thioredoxin